MSTVRFGLLVIAILQALRIPAQDTSTGSPGLVSVKRICVEKFVGDEAITAIVRELSIAGLFSARRFVVTDKCETADAVLKGAILERSENKVRAEGEAAEFGVAGGAASANRHSAVAGVAAAMGGSGESLYSSETGSRATLTVRIVDREGTTVWAYSQDSPGGKTKGAIPDAVDRVIKQLLRDLDRAQARP